MRFLSLGFFFVLILGYLAGRYFPQPAQALGLR